MKNIVIIIQSIISICVLIINIEPKYIDELVNYCESQNEYVMSLI